MGVPSPSMASDHVEQSADHLARMRVEYGSTEKDGSADLDVDWLSMVEVAMAAEEQFGVKIPDDELPKLKTVGDAVKYIESNS